MEGSLLSQGLELMLIGMGTVFSFLTLLVFATRGMSAVALHLQPDVPVAETLTARSSEGVGNTAVVAAIAAALHEHRKSGPPKD